MWWSLRSAIAATMASDRAITKHKRSRKRTEPGQDHGWQVVSLERVAQGLADRGQRAVAVVVVAAAVAAVVVVVGAGVAGGLGGCGLTGPCAGVVEAC